MRSCSSEIARRPFRSRTLCAFRFSIDFSTARHDVFCVRYAPTMTSSGVCAGHQCCGPYTFASVVYMRRRSDAGLPRNSRFMACPASVPAGEAEVSIQVISLSVLPPLLQEPFPYAGTGWTGWDELAHPLDLTQQAAGARWSRHPV